MSVVMATYNGEKYIINQLESIRTQTRQADEVLIFDDNSTDHTSDIVRKYISDNDLVSWSIAINNENVGYKKNFYNGLRSAKGDYIFLADQDDEWMPTKIEVMTKIMAENPRIKSLNCGIEIIDGESKPMFSATRKNYYNANFLYSPTKLNRINYFTFPYILKHNISPGCTMVITKELNRQFIESYKYKLPHDWHMNLLASADSGCCFLNEPLIKYRRHGNNAIGANTGLRKGISSRTREARVAGANAKLETYADLIQYLKLSRGRQNLDLTLHEKETKQTLEYISKYKAFFEAPSIFRLLKLYGYSAYKETNRRGVRFWNIAVALRLDSLIARIVK